MYVEDFITDFIHNKLGRKTVCGAWKVTKEDNGIEVLTFISEGRFDGGKERLAIRYPNGKSIYNASRLEYINTTMAWGNRTRNWRGQTEYQRLCEKEGAIGIPFTMFDGLDYSTLEFIVEPVAEIVNRVRTLRNGTTETTPTHFIGSIVFKIDNKYYLFDIDRKELENDIFNPFIVELPRPVTSVEDAYDSLIPDEVRESTAYLNRQGEYFFVYVGEECPVQITPEERAKIRYVPSRFGFGAESECELYSDTNRYYPNELDTENKREFQKAMKEYQSIIDKFPSEGTFSDGSGSHKATQYIEVDGIMYVSGTISHTRREHGDLNLTGWYKVVKNLAVKSITIRGDVD